MSNGQNNESAGTGAMITTEGNPSMGGDGDSPSSGQADQTRQRVNEARDLMAAVASVIDNSLSQDSATFGENMRQMGGQ